MNSSTPILDELTVEVDTSESRKSRQIRQETQRGISGTPPHEPGLLRTISASRLRTFTLISQLQAAEGALTQQRE